jgi:hypothetical protein
MHLVAQFKIMCHRNNTCGRRNQLAWSSETEMVSPTIEMGLRYQGPWSPHVECVAANSQMNAPCSTPPLTNHVTYSGYLKHKS